MSINCNNAYQSFLSIHRTVLVVGVFKCLFTMLKAFPLFLKKELFSVSRKEKSFLSIFSLERKKNDNFTYVKKNVVTFAYKQYILIYICLFLRIDVPTYTDEYSTYACVFSSINVLRSFTYTDSKIIFPS